MAQSSQPTPRNEAAAKARQQAALQVRAEQRRTTALWIAAAIVVVAVFAILVAFIVRQASVGSINNPNQLTPTVALDNGGIPVGTGGVAGQDLDASRVQVGVYVDFMCPVCGYFEQINAADLDAVRAAGSADIIYHPIAILDYTSLGTNYSTRAAATAVLVAEESPENFRAFVELLFANQPAEGTRGLNDAQLQDLARQAGVPDESVAKIPGYPYSQWVKAATERASIDGVNGTPSLFINGVTQDSRVNPNGVNWQIPGALRAAVEAEANGTSGAGE